jgi:hypothetical protein
MDTIRHTEKHTCVFPIVIEDAHGHEKAHRNVTCGNSSTEGVSLIPGIITAGREGRGN